MTNISNFISRMLHQSEVPKIKLRLIEDEDKKYREQQAQNKKRQKVRRKMSVVIHVSVTEIRKTHNDEITLKKKGKRVLVADTID